MPTTPMGKPPLSRGSPGSAARARARVLKAERAQKASAPTTAPPTVVVTIARLDDCDSKPVSISSDIKKYCDDTVGGHLLMKYGADDGDSKKAREKMNKGLQTGDVEVRQELAVLSQTMKGVCRDVEKKNREVQGTFEIQMELATFVKFLSEQLIKWHDADSFVLPADYRTFTAELIRRGFRRLSDINTCSLEDIQKLFVFDSAEKIDVLPNDALFQIFVEFQGLRHNQSYIARIKVLQGEGTLDEKVKTKPYKGTGWDPYTLKTMLQLILDVLEADQMGLGFFPKRVPKPANLEGQAWKAYLLKNLWQTPPEHTAASLTSWNEDGAVDGYAQAFGPVPAMNEAPADALAFDPNAYAASPGREPLGHMRPLPGRSFVPPGFVGQAMPPNSVGHLSPGSYAMAPMAPNMFPGHNMFHPAPAGFGGWNGVAGHPMGNGAIRSGATSGMPMNSMPMNCMPMHGMHGNRMSGMGSGGGTGLFGSTGEMGPGGGEDGAGPVGGVDDMGSGDSGLSGVGSGDFGGDFGSTSFGGPAVATNLFPAAAAAVNAPSDDDASHDDEEAMKPPSRKRARTSTEDEAKNPE